MTRSHHSNSFKFSTLLASSVVLSGLLLVGPSLPVTTTHAAQSTVTRDASTQAAYAINPPNLEMIAEGDTVVAGSVDISNAPAGTAFTATLNGPEGQQTVNVDADGTFRFQLTNPAGANAAYSATITATTPTGTLTSLPATAAVRAAGTVDPLLGYTVPAPTISSLQDGDTSFSGNVNIAGAPAGTSFIVFVVDSSGTPIAQANNVDGSGNFSGTLTNGASFKAGETYHFTAVVQRQADGDPNPFYKYSSYTSVVPQSVTPPEENPLADYTVPTPVFSPLKVGDTTLNGTIDLSQAPANTTFTVTVTLPDGTTTTVTPDATGHFTVALNQPVQAGQTFTGITTATNDGFTKTGQQGSITETEAENPLANYTVAPPTVNDVFVSDTTVTGRIDTTGAPANTTFVVTLTLPDGTKKTVVPDANGNFSFPIDAAQLGQNYQLMVTATNGAFTKDSSSVSVTVKARDNGNGGNTGNNGNNNGGNTGNINHNGNNTTGGGRVPTTNQPSAQKPHITLTHENQTVFPATSDQQQSWLTALGIALMSLAGLLGIHRRKQSN
ncbi:LPXTG cell wall anchor domain-containing protein [Lacticaseibacillus saniviri]|uniref:LPXTG cell wall anchor domain-containing protein n=1 Tax=Lacticaseibacillus saniviri TaxID=931533 RepID=UPI000704C90F|nr:LPXTG cell wall anchor domain-containing protein [Lacticaseibacillus saniviri]MCG4282698.1 LPXTG cell wall anchor domain-containing protein [Lacticaseibacillus saniviri]